MRTTVVWAFGLVMMATAGCGELEPMVEPEMADLQLIVDTLKTQVRDSQRALEELRSELESRRQELADAQVTRAQLEGRVREAERRVAETRHVIDLQREELVAARTERQRILRSSLQLHSQLKQLQKHLSKSGISGGQEAAPASYDGSGRNGHRAAVPSQSADTGPQAASKRLSKPAALLGTASTGERYSEERNLKGASVRAVFVKPGDTLWSIAKRYGVDLSQLRSMNYLTDNTIVVGQAIWVPADRISRNVAPDSAGAQP